MPKIVDAKAQRAEIRRAAMRVFARRGVAETGLVHVADELGTGRSSLYHYYPDKAALVDDLVRELLDEEAAMFAAAARGEGTPLERIERLAVACTALFEPWRELGRMAFDLRSLTPAHFGAFFGRIRADLAGVVAQGQAAGDIDPRFDPAIAAATVIGAIDGLLLQYCVDPDAFGDPAGLAGTLAALVRKVLRP